MTITVRAGTLSDAKRAALAVARTLGGLVSMTASRDGDERVVTLRFAEG